MFVPLHNHSSSSLLDGISQPKDIAKRCVELGYKAIALTDHGNVSGIPLFASEMKKVGVRPLLGVETYLSKDLSTVKTADNRRLAHLCVLAKNLRGWKQLLRLVSRSNEKDRVYYGKPRLSLDELAEFTQGGDLFAFSGHPGSEIGEVIFEDARMAYRASSYEEARKFVHPDASNRLIAMVEHYVSVFGRENFRLEDQVLDPELMPASLLISKAVRWASAKTKIPVIATPDSHYVYPEDAYDQRVVLCNNLRTSLPQVARKIEEQEDVTLGAFFRSNAFHIPTEEDMRRHHTTESIEETARVAEMIEDYSILSKPKLPDYPLTGGLSQEEFLRQACREGWRTLVEDNNRISRPIEEYRERLDMEFGVIEKAGLSGYFNINRHIRNFSLRRNRWLGRARGSAGGCLISYLAGITFVDPVEYDLDFTRFYNDGRNTEDHVSYPDIDSDCPKDEGPHVFREIQRVFGDDYVGKISTFSKLQGRSAIEVVLDAHGVPFELRKLITAAIPDKNRISEELQDIAENGGNPSPIAYALDVYADELSEWVVQDDDGNLSGEYARYFEQAMRLEGVKKVRSTHAAGVVISAEPLRDVCPLRWDDEEKSWVADMEYEQLEAMGLVKLDNLRVKMLDKLEGVRNQVRTGRL